MFKRSLSLTALLLTACLPARAADLPTNHFQPAPVPVAQPFFYDYEVRFGGLIHDYYSQEGGSVDLNGELLFPKLWHLQNGFWDQFIPHPDIGFTANFVGKTSNLYAGAAWNFDITQRLFFSVEFGPGVNNGRTGADVPMGHNAIGCNAWFHESASAGYRVTENWSVMGTIEHSSNAGLCDENRGVTNYGVRLGYRF